MIPQEPYHAYKPIISEGTRADTKLFTPAYHFAEAQMKLFIQYCLTKGAWAACGVGREQQVLSECMELAKECSR